MPGRPAQPVTTNPAGPEIEPAASRRSGSDADAGGAPGMRVRRPGGLRPDEDRPHPRQGGLGPARVRAGPAEGDQPPVVRVRGGVALRLGLGVVGQRGDPLSGVDVSVVEDHRSGRNRRRERLDHRDVLRRDPHLGGEVRGLRAAVPIAPVSRPPAPMTATSAPWTTPRSGGVMPARTVCQLRCQLRHADRPDRGDHRDDEELHPGEPVQAAPGEDPRPDGMEELRAGHVEDAEDGEQRRRQEPPPAALRHEHQPSGADQDRR